ncbi:MAG: hypothetical protein K2X37_12800, partial [Chitinophagaceae bacterium]|nr:hypothetical protein [Chitinophagaceae bacterium]
MEQRRSFLRKAGALSGMALGYGFFNQLHATNFTAAQGKIAHLTPLQAASEEDYWQVIQQAYTVNANLINLNNGGVYSVNRPDFLTGANISICLTDEFMHAVIANENYDLRFPDIDNFD